MLNCVISHSPSLNVSRGPRSTSTSMKPCPFLKGGKPAKTIGGMVTIAPMAAPSPRVMAERNVLRLVSCCADRRARDLLARSWRCRRGRRWLVLAHDVVDPGDAEEHDDHGADGHDPPAHEQADECERDADGNADRPEARCRRVTLLGLVHRSPGLRVACCSIQSCRISPVNVVTVASRPYSRQRLSTSSLISADISISSGHSRASSSGSLCVASMPSLPP